MVLDLEIIASNVEEKIGDPVPLTTETIKQDNPFKTPEKSPQSIKKPKLSPIESLTIPQQITPIIELKPYSSLLLFFFFSFFSSNFFKITNQFINFKMENSS